MLKFDLRSVMYHPFPRSARFLAKQVLVKEAEPAPYMAPPFRLALFSEKVLDIRAALEDTS